MSYIGSNPITQFFLEGTDQFPVLDVDTSMFTMTRPVPTINAISVNVGNNNLLPIVSNYTVNGATLTLVAPVRNTTVYVRYLTASNYSITPNPGSLNINVLDAIGIPSIQTLLRGDNSWSQIGIPQLSATGSPSNLTFLRGDNTWAPVTGTVSNVSFASPASLAFSVATPSTTPVISLANVGATPSAVFLRGDGTWVVPTSISNTGGWAVAQSGTKLAFTFNGVLVASLGSNGLFTSANNVTAFGTP